MHHKKPLSVLLLCVLLISSCSTIPTLTHQHPSTPPIEQPLLVKHRFYRVVQLCLDTPPVYAPALFHQAVNTMADWIESDVTVNQDGFVVYIGEITSSSYQVSPLDPIEVPAIPADSQEPPLFPTYTPTPEENPYHAANVQATRDALNAQTAADWQHQLTSNHAAVATALAQMNGALTRLRSLTPIYDDKGEDSFGCLADASAHFQTSPTAEHDIILAASLVNNQTINQTAAINLAGAHVRAIYHPCTSAPACSAHDAWLKQTVIQFGANPDVACYDPQQSVLLSPLF